MPPGLELCLLGVASDMSRFCLGSSFGWRLKFPSEVLQALDHRDCHRNTWSQPPPFPPVHTSIYPDSSIPSAGRTHTQEVNFRGHFVEHQPPQPTVLRPDVGKTMQRLN